MAMVRGNGKPPEKEAPEKEEGGSAFVQSMRATPMARPLQASLKDVPSEVRAKAQLVKASRIAYERGFAAAQQYLDRERLPYTIDLEHSSTESLVLLGEDGQVKIAYRGTKVENPSDILSDAGILAGQEGRTPQYRSAEGQLARVTETYGQPSQLIGYSLGGNKALYFGMRNGISTTTFNPFLGKNLLFSTDPTGEASHEVFRTTEDFASFGVGLAKAKKNFLVRSVHPHQDKINPVEAHELENFSELSSRRPGFTEQLLASVDAQGRKTGELEMLHSIANAQEQGLTYTEWARGFATDNQGAPAGSRFRDSKFARFWEEAHSQQGTSRPPFTPEEEAAFARSSTPQYEITTRRGDRNAFASKSQAEREARLVEEQVQLDTLIEGANSHTEPYKSSANTLARAVHPTTLATGIAGGFAAHELMDEVIDKDHSIDPNLRTATEGGAAGVMTEMGAAALAGTALTAGGAGVAGAAGAASYLAAQGTHDSLRSALDQIPDAHEDPKEALADTVAGGVGGGVAAATAIGGAALMGAELGTMGGPAGIAIGVGVGTLVGLGGFLIGKLGG